ncbi:MAG: hypothetical protein ABIP49_09285 [Lysobacterales bacterium]
MLLLFFPTQRLAACSFVASACKTEVLLVDESHAKNKLGLAGWCHCRVVGTHVRHFARSAIRRNPDQLDGNAMAIFGLAVGYVGLASGIFAVLLLTMALTSFGGR